MLTNNILAAEQGYSGLMSLFDKKAYASHSEHPKSKQSYLVRIEKFFEDTGYVLRIENRIVLP